MRKTIYLILFLASGACTTAQPNTTEEPSQNADDQIIVQTELTNSKISSYPFLDCMYQDPYFPKFLVDKSKLILLKFCSEIETKKPSNLEELYKLSHSATNQINDLEAEFAENDSEIETAARECLALNFEFIANAYGFDADLEELIATRDW